ncbi:MAG: SIS domain-containing protein [Chloroflexi bacterium]|nr:SIS domain-containing protein [Chloroflexota bacterium]
MSDFHEFIEAYYERFTLVLKSIDRSALDPIRAVLVGLRSTGGVLWVAGNGGSAAISDHAVCDTTKGAFRDGGRAIRAIALTSNAAMLTAVANDLSYEEVFSKQLEFYLNEQDAVLLVSSSGDSPNVVRACEYARGRGVPTMAFVGFDGGRLKDLADHVVHVPIHNYGMVEDAHQSLMHVLTQYLAQADTASEPPAPQSSAMSSDA